MDHNPYSAPLSTVDGPTADTPDGAVADRRDHLNVERGLAQMGMLYLIGGAAVCAGLVFPVFMLFELATGSGDALEPGGVGMWALMLVLYGVVGPANVWIGLGLRRRNPGVRVLASIFAGLSLLSVPLGTILGGYLLWLMWSTKGKRVFAPDYQAVIDATPEVVAKTSLLVWTAGGLLVLFLGCGVLLLFAG